MELLQLRYFCDAAETEKFSETAKNFLVPVSNISQSVKRLERELGTELFEHKGNRVKLNTAGKEFYGYVSRAIALIDNGRSRLTDTDEALGGDIRIVCETNYGIVTMAIEKFLKKYPDVNFIVQQELPSDYDYDILISDRFPDQYSQRVLLVDDAVCVAMNKNHPLASKSRVTVAELENEKFVTLTINNSMKKIMLNACREAGFSPNIAIRTYDTSYLRRYIKMGLGISFTPGSWRKKHSDEIEFKELENLRRRTYAFLPKRIYIRRAVEAFLEELKAETEALSVK
jgi:LysR family transcriptional activator of glutamate synthase operon